MLSNILVLKGWISTGLETLVVVFLLKLRMSDLGDFILENMVLRP